MKKYLTITEYLEVIMRNINDIHFYICIVKCMQNTILFADYHTIIFHSRSLNERIPI